MITITSRITRRILLLTIGATISWTAIGTSMAHDHDAWSHDHDGYWDGHGRHHAYIMHENHHGYWRDRDNGSRIFINID